MSSVNKILLWIRICYFISYTVMYSFVEFESLKKWLILPLPTCPFLTFAIINKLSQIIDHSGARYKSFYETSAKGLFYHSFTSPQTHLARNGELFICVLYCINR